MTATSTSASTKRNVSLITHQAWRRHSSPGEDDANFSPLTGMAQPASGREGGAQSQAPRAPPGDPNTLIWPDLVRGGLSPLSPMWRSWRGRLFSGAGAGPTKCATTISLEMRPVARSSPWTSMYRMIGLDGTLHRRFKNQSSARPQRRHRRANGLPRSGRPWRVIGKGQRCDLYSPFVCSRIGLFKARRPRSLFWSTDHAIQEPVLLAATSKCPSLDGRFDVERENRERGVGRPCGLAGKAAETEQGSGEAYTLRASNRHPPSLQRSGREPYNQELAETLHIQPRVTLLQDGHKGDQRQC